MSDAQLLSKLAPTGRRYFPTLDALRLLAFGKTFLAHVQLGSFPVLDQVRRGSGLGVPFFFVLSGFLITYLACLEKKETGKLRLKHFYWRRVLRIWPLYYTVVALGLAIPWLLQWLNQQGSFEGYAPTWWVSGLFLDNYKTMWLRESPSVSVLAVLWSVCVEEHFYIVWGLLIAFVPLRYMKWVLGGGIVMGLCCRIAYAHLGIIPLDLPTRIDLFAWGGVPALLLVQNRKRAEDASRRIPVFLGWAYLLFTMAFAWQVGMAPLYNSMWYLSAAGAVFSGLLFLLLAPVRPWQLSATNPLCRLGFYTYGLYMWHEVGHGVAKRTFQWLHWPLTEPVNAIGYLAMALLLTIGLALVSFRIIERPFLCLKHKFQ
jgi:peptidoglycan/LPS O-acetylase OafA/YrhL